MKPVPSFLQTKSNEDILRFVDGKSCHGDLAEPVQQTLMKLQDVKSFCPDGASFRYAIWYRNSLVFVAGTGMKSVTIRLPEPLGAKAIQDGVATNCDGMPGWYNFWPFQESFSNWLLEAYIAAEEQ